jgi:hypothetical protein
VDLRIDQTREDVLSSDVEDFLSVGQGGVFADRDKLPVLYRDSTFDNTVGGNDFAILDDQVGAFSHWTSSMLRPGRRQATDLCSKTLLDHLPGLVLSSLASTKIAASQSSPINAVWPSSRLRDSYSMEEMLVNLNNSKVAIE